MTTSGKKPNRNLRRVVRSTFTSDSLTIDLKNGPIIKAIELRYCKNAFSTYFKLELCAKPAAHIPDMKKANLAALELCQVIIMAHNKIPTAVI